MESPIKWPKKRKSWSFVQLLTTTAATVAVLYCITTLYHGDGKNTVEDSFPKRPVTRLHPSLLNDPAPEWLFNLSSFSLVRESDKCSNVHSKTSAGLKFVVLVHSKPEHFRQRQVIRNTWASHPQLKTVFLLGLDPVTDPLLDTSRLLQLEQTKHNDLVQGNFVDTYQNLTYKHIMGFKWFVHNCNKDIDYVIKADDDVIIDVFQLEDFLQRTFPEMPPDSILCNVFTEGSTALRDGRYAVDETEYPWKNYPKFCGGLAYVTTPSTVRKLLRAARWIPFLWIDDVYVTGLLAEAVSVQHFCLNLRYTYDVADVEQQPKKWPYIFGELDTTRSDWRETAEELWRKVSSTT